MLLGLGLASIGLAIVALGLGAFADWRRRRIDDLVAASAVFIASTRRNVVTGQAQPRTR